MYRSLAPLRLIRILAMSMPFLLESESVSSSELFISSVSDALVKSDKTEYGFLSSRGLATSNGTHLKTKIQDLSLSQK